ncbi:2384_t:CDS:2, partial [Funneliformis mosseae]
LDELNNIYYYDEDTVFEALWNESVDKDDIIAIKYEFYTDINKIEIQVQRILYRAIKYYWSVQDDINLCDSHTINSNFSNDISEKKQEEGIEEEEEEEKEEKEDKYKNIDTNPFEW